LERADRIGNADVSRKRKAAPVERFDGPNIDELIATAPAIPPQPEPRTLTFEELCKLDDAQDDQMRAWELSIAARVRAGEVSIERALVAVRLYGGTVTRYQRQRMFFSKHE
jgi:hypothetical protein